MSQLSGGDARGAVSGATWRRFREEAPAPAETVENLLRVRPAYLATVDADGAPRVHPVTPVIDDGHLWVFMEPTSPKGRDLEVRGRYALHNGVPDDAGTGGECSVRGVGHPVVDPAQRAAAVQAATYPPEDRYVLYELTLLSVTTTRYEAGDVRRRRWSHDGSGPVA